MNYRIAGYRFGAGDLPNAVSELELIEQAFTVRHQTLMAIAKYYDRSGEEESRCDADSYFASVQRFKECTAKRTAGQRIWVYVLLIRLMIRRSPAQYLKTLCPTVFAVSHLLPLRVSLTAPAHLSAQEVDRSSRSGIAARGEFDARRKLHRDATDGIGRTRTCRNGASQHSNNILGRHSLEDQPRAWSPRFGT